MRTYFLAFKSSKSSVLYSALKSGPAILRYDDFENALAGEESGHRFHAVVGCGLFMAIGIAFYVSSIA